MKLALVFCAALGLQIGCSADTLEVPFESEKQGQDSVKENDQGFGNGGSDAGPLVSGPAPGGCGLGPPFEYNALCNVIWEINSVEGWQIVSEDRDDVDWIVEDFLQGMSVRFGSDGVVSVDTGCSRGVGSFEVSNGSLRFDEMTFLSKECEGELLREQSRKVEEQFSSPTLGFEMDLAHHDSLGISGPMGVLGLSRAQGCGLPPPFEYNGLCDVTWYVDEVADLKPPWASEDAAKGVTLFFGSDRVLTVQTACSKETGSFRLTNGNVYLEEMSFEESKKCEPGQLRDQSLRIEKVFADARVSFEADRPTKNILSVSSNVTVLGASPEQH